LQPRHLTLETYRTYARTLIARFGGRLLSDFNEDDIVALIRQRQAEGCKPRRINFELGVLRMVLRDFGLWDAVNGRVRPLRARHDVGQAVIREDEGRIFGHRQQEPQPGVASARCAQHRYGPTRKRDSRPSLSRPQPHMA
jgi:hypothetical protein